MTTWPTCPSCSVVLGLEQYRAHLMTVHGLGRDAAEQQALRASLYAREGER